MTTHQKEKRELQAEMSHPNRFVHWPLSALGKLSVATLALSGLLCTLVVVFVGLDALGLLILATILLLCAGIAATGLRWATLPGSLVSIVLLIEFLFLQPYVIYHLTQPKDTFFMFFVVILLILVNTFTALWASIGATFQNYLSKERRTPRWFSSALSGMTGLAIGAILIAAVAQPAAVATTTNGEPTVHMGAGNFSQSSINVPKGSKLLIVDDSAIVHVLSTGTWNNGTPKTEQLPGEPTVNNLQISGKSVEIGPFTTAGTYHIFCLIHQNMTLTIVVQ